MSIPRVLIHAPLVPVATACTLGIVIDRYYPLPLSATLATAIFCLVAACLQRGKKAGLSWLYLAISVIALGAAYHCMRVRDYPSDDVSNFVTPEHRLARVKGTIAEEPVVRPREHSSIWSSIPQRDSERLVIDVVAIRGSADWQPASGRLLILLGEPAMELHIGDRVEAIGQLERPEPPLNPGGWDRPKDLRDQGICAELRVRSAGGIMLIEKGWPASFLGWLGVLRNRGQRILAKEIPASESGVAMALLLGEGSPLTSADWERYVRTGVIHVLAISGQHLVVLAAFLWVLFRSVGINRRRGAILVALFLLSYALLTGGRPSAMRSGIAAVALCGSVILRQPAVLANTFALSWLGVIILNPADLFSVGFQLSFLCVAVLCWGIPRWFPARPPTPIEKLIQESRPAWQRFLRWCIHWAGQAYLITLILGLTTAPLVMAQQNVISISGLLIGPWVILFSTFALLAGFVVLLIAPLSSFLAAPFAWVTTLSLRICDSLVGWGDGLPGGCWYVSSLPDWWVVGFYLLGLALLLAPELKSIRPIFTAPRLAMVLLGWTCFGLAWGLRERTSDELRVTFVAVGHGGCTVMETPDGRVFLYDAGSLAGSDVTRQHIAPFLWNRGIHRIDELFLSHADLDHFNGVTELLRRFSVGRITMTPSFADKHAAGVQALMARIEAEKIDLRIAKRGDRFVAGDVTLEVLHPPSIGPDGVENVRSLVLLVRHAGRSILLTGDLEKEGLAELFALPKTPVDVLMGPHHGSPAANTAGWVAWAQPKLVVICQGSGQGSDRPLPAFEKAGIPVWRSWPDGAVIIHSRAGAWSVESYATHRHLNTNGSGE